MINTCQPMLEKAYRNLSGLCPQLPDLLPVCQRRTFLCLYIPDTRIDGKWLFRLGGIKRIDNLLTQPKILQIFESENIPRDRGIRVVFRELALNLAMHAGGGKLQISKISEKARAAIEISSLDMGSGIRDLPELIRESRQAHTELIDSQNISSPVYSITGLGTEIIFCDHADRVELESNGRRWVLQNGKILEESCSRLKAGSFIRLLFYLD